MMPQTQDTGLVSTPISQQNCLARALYDNIAETPDELAFRKGEVLVVLEQNTAGIEGWWLCSLRGRQGICPGNRLRLIPGMYADTGQRETTTPSPVGGHQQQQLTPTTPVEHLGTLQRQGKRRSWHVQPNKVLTPKKFNDVYLYDLPPQRCSPVQGTGGATYYDVPPSRSESPASRYNNTSTPEPHDVYDVPPRAVPVNYDTPRNNWRSSPSPAPPITAPAHHVRRESIDSYDVPRPLLLTQQQITPSSSASSLTTADSFSSSNRSSLANMPDYDVPKSRPTPVNNPSTGHLGAQTPTSTGPQLQLHQLQNQSVYDVPAANPQPKELPLELSSALDTLEKLESEATAAIGRLLGFVTPQWRCKEKLEPKLMDIKLAAVRLRTSLHDLAEFSEGALGNAARAPDKGLSAKLRPLVKSLRDTDTLVQKAGATLDDQNWSLDKLCRPEGHDDNSTKPPDALDQLIACSRALTEDVRQIASFIQGNGTLLFKRATSPQQSNSEDWLEDYDYVNLESREAVAKEHAEIREALPTELRKGYDALVRNAESAAITNDAKASENQMDPNDKRVLTFYAQQAITHSTHLTHAIDAFLQTVEHNQPPKVFLAHSKFVVLSAHRLVHIGDTVHRNVTKNDVRTNVLNCANALSDALAATVNKTKKAAMQFPSVTAVQEMVDSVVDISHLARDLKLSLIQAAQQP